MNHWPYVIKLSELSEWGYVTYLVGEDPFNDVTRNFEEEKALYPHNILFVKQKKTLRFF